MSESTAVEESSTPAPAETRTPSYDEIVAMWRTTLDELAAAVLAPCGSEPHEDTHQALIQYLRATEGPLLDALPPPVHDAFTRFLAMHALHTAKNHEGVRAILQEGTVFGFAVCAYVTALACKVPPSVPDAAGEPARFPGYL